MLTNPAPSQPPVATNPSPVTPQSPPRSSRLRGLSYLRSYTQQHLSSSNRSPRHTPSRSVSYPAGDNTTPPTNPDPESGPLEPGGEAAVENQPTSPTRPGSGSLPIVGPASALSRPVRSQTTGSRSSLPAAADSTSPPNNESQDSDIMARRRNLTSRNPTSAPDPNYSREAMRFARLDGSPNPDPVSQDLSPQATADTDMTAVAKEPSQPKDPAITFLPHQDPRSSRPSLIFPPVTRTLKHPSSIIRVGRYSERETIIHSGPNEVDAAPVGFKSKVVSRKHCEFWFSEGKWWIKDVKSSSGTFLNHIRLSPANQESKPYQVNDGDVIQLGIDFRGGEEQIFRCVKIKVESNRTWQKKLNNFNVNTHKRLRALGKSDSKEEDGTAGNECVICLMAIAPCQALFVAPCSHVWHYKCIHPMLQLKSYPTFVCPNCRAVANLEADVDIPDEEGEDWEDPSDTNDTNMPDENGDTRMGNGIQEDAVITTDEAAAVLPECAEGHGPSPSVDDQSVSSQTFATCTSMPLVDGQSVSAQSLDGNEGSRRNGSKSSTAGPSLASRRQASNVSLPRDGSGAVTSIPMPVPVTPTRATEGAIFAMETDGANQEDRTRLRSSTPPTSEQVTQDGLLTPTNNAGPFVLDGSAGRLTGTGRHLTATVENISDSSS